MSASRLLKTFGFSTRSFSTLRSVVPFCANIDESLWEPFHIAHGFRSQALMRDRRTLKCLFLFLIFFLFVLFWNEWVKRMERQASEKSKGGVREIANRARGDGEGAAHERGRLLWRFNDCIRTLAVPYLPFWLADWLANCLLSFSFFYVWFPRFLCFFVTSTRRLYSSSTDDGRGMRAASKMNSVLIRFPVSFSRLLCTSTVCIYIYVCVWLSHNILRAMSKPSM